MLVTLVTLLPVLTVPAVLARHVVPLHRQRVPVQGDDDRISYKSVYFGSVAVGKPEQKFSVVFDTGSGHVILPSSECHSETCRIHNRYDKQASDGAIDVDYDGTPVRSGAPWDQITVAFGTGEVTGNFVHDRICLSPEAAPASQSAGMSYTEPLLLVQSGDALERGQPGENITQVPIMANVSTPLRHEAMNCVDLRVVMATEMTEEPFHAFAFDGLLGLGFSFFGMMAKQVALEEPSFGVFLADSDDEISEISFGGISPDKITSALTWAKVASPELGYWQVQVNSIRIGNRTLDYCDDGECRAVVDTGTSLLAVPEDFAEQLQQDLETALTDPTPSPSGGVDCRFASGLPLHFDVEGRSITLLPADYSRQAVHAEVSRAGPGHMHVKSLRRRGRQEDQPAQCNGGGFIRAPYGTCILQGVDASSVLGARGGYGYDDQQVYIDSRGHVNHEAPAEAVTSFDGTFTTDLPQWNQSALRLMQADSSPAANEECQIAERRQRSRPRLQRAMTRRERRLERTLSGQPYHVMDTARAVVQAGSSLLPASALPPHALPGVLVRRYTFLISFLWIVSGVMHGIRWTSNHVIIADEPPTLVGSALRVSWPKPQHLFEVNALSCNSSHHVSVTNRFGRFQGLLRGDIAFEEMPEEPPGLLEDLHLKIPSEWPLWCAQPCKGCEHTERWVAGWTGEEIFVGVARNSSIRIRYALRASFASCRGTSAWPKTAAIFGSCSISVSEENYTDVQALHMMNGAQLLVLHRGSLLDAWDLREGILLGRFSLPGASPAAAFCILQESLAPHLLLARRSKSRMGSPTLEMLSLPALWPASCQDPGGCSSQPAEEEGSSTESTKSDGESENLIS